MYRQWKVQFTHQSISPRSVIVIIRIFGQVFMFCYFFQGVLFRIRKISKAFATVALIILTITYFLFLHSVLITGKIPKALIILTITYFLFFLCVNNCLSISLLNSRPHLTKSIYQSSTFHKNQVSLQPIEKWKYSHHKCFATDQQLYYSPGMTWSS